MRQGKSLGRLTPVTTQDKRTNAMTDNLTLQKSMSVCANMLDKLQDCKELMQEGESSSNSAINALDIVMVSPEKERADWLAGTLLIYKIIEYFYIVIS